MNLVWLVLSSAAAAAAGQQTMAESWAYLQAWVYASLYACMRKLSYCTQHELDRGTARV
jgi:hypothetical protein